MSLVCRRLRRKVFPPDLSSEEKKKEKSLRRGTSRGKDRASQNRFWGSGVDAEFSARYGGARETSGDEHVVVEKGLSPRVYDPHSDRANGDRISSATGGLVSRSWTGGI